MNLEGIRVILASKSPRRRELLGKIIKDFEIITEETSEELPIGIMPPEGTRILALRKGRAVALGNPDSLVLSSDTLVELDGVSLGKPRDREDAVRMLGEMSGRAHHVHTGVAVHYRGRAVSGVATATVKFKSLTPAEIEEYVSTGEPMDKAGSYGIQGLGGKFVLEYEGDFDTIMGLSLKLSEELIREALKSDDV